MRMSAAKPSACTVCTPFASVHVCRLTVMEHVERTVPHVPIQHSLISEPPRNSMHLSRSDALPTMITRVLHFIYGIMFVLAVFPAIKAWLPTSDIDCHGINCQCQLTLHQHLTCKPTNGRGHVRLCTTSKKRGVHMQLQHLCSHLTD